MVSFFSRCGSCLSNCFLPLCWSIENICCDFSIVVVLSSFLPICTLHLYVCLTSIHPYNNAHTLIHLNQQKKIEFYSRLLTVCCVLLLAFFFFNSSTDFSWFTWNRINVGRKRVEFKWMLRVQRKRWNDTSETNHDRPGEKKSSFNFISFSCNRCIIHTTSGQPD